MSGFTSVPPSSNNGAATERSPVVEPPGGPGLPGRPAPEVSLRDHADAVLRRIPISPGRLLLVVAAGIAAVVVAVWLFRPPPPAVESTLPRATPAAALQTVSPSVSTPPSSTVSQPVVVDAAGAVARPGLYRLATGARVNDLIRVAGGLRTGADPDRLNLAAPLADGQRLYVPKVGESIAPLAVDPTSSESPITTPTDRPGAGASGSESGADGPASPIDLNAASVEELDTLPGVGPTTAASIVDYRTQHGPFHSVDDLLDVRGIGDAKLAALRAKVRV